MWHDRFESSSVCNKCFGSYNLVPNFLCHGCHIRNQYKLQLSVYLGFLSVGLVCYFRVRRSYTCNIFFNGCLWVAWSSEFMCVLLGWRLDLKRPPAIASSAKVGLYSLQLPVSPMGCIAPGPQAHTSCEVHFSGTGTDIASWSWSWYLIEIWNSRSAGNFALRALVKICDFLIN